MQTIATPWTAWGLLLLAGLLEIAWATLMKSSEGFSRHGPAALCIGLAWLSFFLLGFATRSLPIGTAYAIWTGIGAVGVAACGILWFGERADPARIACIGLIVAGIVGLKWLAPR